MYVNEELCHCVSHTDRRQAFSVLQSLRGRKPRPPPPSPGSLPPSSQTLRWGFHCSVHSSFNSLTKSLYLKLGIVLNVCTIRPRLNQLRSSKLNQGFIIELMIRILMPLIYPVPFCHTAGRIICSKSILRCVKVSWQYSMFFRPKA